MFLWQSLTLRLVRRGTEAEEFADFHLKIEKKALNFENKAKLKSYLSSQIIQSLLRGVNVELIRFFKGRRDCGDVAEFFLFYFIFFNKNPTFLRAQ